MSQRIGLTLALLAACCTFAAAEKQENWLQVRSPHFIVVTNANEKNGRRIADQFERMRSVFHVVFPKLQIDPNAPIVVIAVKDEKDFRALEPQAYLAKGSLKLGGLFLRAPEKNYVLMHVGAEGEHPYSVIYHEYTHLLTSKADGMPLWMNEGLASFYENTDIRDHEVDLGQANSNDVLYLRQNSLIPLPILLAVDQHSPYYHEENKGSIFYAESWALTHYLYFADILQRKHRLHDYLSLVEQEKDPVQAASEVFGDLKNLQNELNSYIRNNESFHYIKQNAPTDLDESAFKVEPLTGPQADAIRADFLAYNQRFSDSQALLDHVLQADPNNVSAHETKGFLAFREGHLEDAKKWYQQAVQLDSQSYLAHYYYAVMAMSGPSDEQDQVESSLRAAIKLNPSFAPAFDRLAVSLAMRHKNLDEARMMGLTAVSLEPTNIGYRINIANVYMTMQQPKNAVTVLQTAVKLAKTPADVQMANNALMHAQEYAESQERYEKEKAQYERSMAESSEGSSHASEGPPTLKRRNFVAKGPHQFLVGTLKSVHCDRAAMDLTVSSKSKDLAVHADNYYSIPFSALGFQPSSDLNPCSDLENRPAKVEYVESAKPDVNAQLISVELHK